MSVLCDYEVHVKGSKKTCQMVYETMTSYGVKNIEKEGNEGDSYFIVFTGDCRGVVTEGMIDQMDPINVEKMKEEWSSIVDGNVEISFFSKHDVEQFQAFIVRVAVDGTDIVIAPYEEISEMAANGYIKDNYYLLSDDSFYSELLNIGDMFDKYDDVYLGEACRGANADNSALIYKRYSNE